MRNSGHVTVCRVTKFLSLYVTKQKGSQSNFGARNRNHYANRSRKKILSSYNVNYPILYLIIEPETVSKNKSEAIMNVLGSVHEANVNVN